MFDSIEICIFGKTNSLRLACGVQSNWTLCGLCGLIYWACMEPVTLGVYPYDAGM